MFQLGQMNTLMQVINLMKNINANKACAAHAQFDYLMGFGALRLDPVRKTWTPSSEF